MTDQEINIAIAEACGKLDRPPDCHDLNAMHEVEKTLRENQFHFASYLRELWKVVHPNVEWIGELGYIGFDFVNATARQRAEAFLKTIGKWKHA